MKKWFSILVMLMFVLPLAGAGAETGAGSEALSEILDQLSRNSQQVESLCCDFIQEKHLDILDDSLSSTGRFSFQRPDRLRWEIVEPVSSGIVISGEDGGTWHSRTGESEHFKTRDVPAIRILSQQLFAFALMDFNALKEQFQISLLQKEPAVILLTPHTVDIQDYIQSLQVTMAPGGQHVEAVKMNESDGDYTTIRFSNVVVNPPLDRVLFELP
jgi:outer membrane lipoprotein-sorting protein